MSIRFAALLAAAVASSALAGDLNPPPGPIAPTLKTLAEVEPRTVLNSTNTPGDADSFYQIRNPGSYYLTENLTFGGFQSGIEITTSDVTIDLNGFTIEGFAGAQSGIIAAAGSNLRNISIRNGNITGVVARGIDLLIASESSVEDVNVRDVGGDGIALSARGHVRGCEVVDARDRGIYVLSGYIERCSVDQAGAEFPSIEMDLNGSIIDCRVQGSIGPGFDIGSDVTLDRCNASVVTAGFAIGGSGCVLRDCSASFCFEDGYQIDGNARLVGCSANQNSQRGFNANAPVVYDTCAADGNGNSGFRLAESSTIQNSTATNNGGGSGVFDAGIEMVGGSTAIGCSANRNNGSGINVIFTTSGATIRGCTAKFNTFDGIYGDSNSSIVGCTVEGNGRGIVNTGGVIADCHVSNSTGDGIASNGSVIKGCTSQNNGGRGFDSDGCVIESCVARNNDEEGIFVGSDGSVINCTSRFNTLSGIEVEDGSRVEGCVSNDNGRHGILAVRNCAVVGNSCFSNDDNGIQGQGQNIHIDSNIVTFNAGPGIRTLDGDASIVRNTAHNNSPNYMPFSMNGFGPLTQSPGSAGPWDNFSY